MGRGEQRSQNPVILIVDDNPANVKVIIDYLTEYGFQIMVARTGEAGLELARQDRPDLILLDVVLPGADGFEVCRRLKADGRTRQIPVILMTILTSVEDKLKGFQAGSVDYITKPFQAEEVLARVRIHLQLRELTEHLEQKVAERTEALHSANAQLQRELAERKKAEEALRLLNMELDHRVLDRTAQLEAFSYSVSHDLRAPLRHIDGFLELLQKKIETALDEQGRHYMDNISKAAQKMGLLIDDLLIFSRMGRHAMSLGQVALEPLVRNIIRELEPDAAGRNIEWCIGDLPPVDGDGSMLQIVLDNLIANAIKFTRPREKARIEIRSLPDRDTETVIYVRDNGVGFDMAHADKLFGVFQRLHREEEFEGTGIGLANVHRIIVRHGGRTWAEGKPDQGATFYFGLPRTG